MDIITTGTAIYLSQKLLGKTFDVLSSDISHLYEKGRNKIIQKATEKILNKDDGHTANLRVARDVFWNGSFTEEAICAEYFGGILASSRSEDGQDDNGVHYTDVIKSLSSKQLELHYVIYNSLNKLFVNSDKKVNVGMGSEVEREEVWFSLNELRDTLKLNIETDLNILFKQGLISNYKTDVHKIDAKRTFPYIKVNPTTFGILLYTIAHNKLDHWRNFNENDFGNFENINLPSLCGSSMNDLLKKLNIDIEVKK